MILQNSSPYGLFSQFIRFYFITTLNDSVNIFMVTTDNDDDSNVKETSPAFSTDKTCTVCTGESLCTFFLKIQYRKKTFHNFLLFWKSKLPMSSMDLCSIAKKLAKDFYFDKLF